MKAEDLLILARKRFDAAAEATKIQREQGIEDLKFLAGDQWDESVRQQRTASRPARPCLTFNRLPQFTQQVIGDARQNKPAIKVHPVDEGADVETAEIYEGLIRNIEAQSRAPQAYITALEHSVGSGSGAWRIVTEYSTDDAFEQDIRVKRITDPFAVFWDPSAKEYDKSDADWCFVSDWMTKETFAAKYPGKDPNDWEDTYAPFENKESWMLDNLVRVVEYWVKKPVDKKIGLLPNGQVVDFVEGVQFKRVRTVRTHKVCRYVLSAHAILEEEKDFPCRWIPIIPVYGPEEYIDGASRPRSLIRYAKDPQRMYNFWQSSLAEAIANSPKSPWLVTPKMVAGLEALWNKSNIENRAYLPYNADPDSPGNYPRRQDPALIQPAMIQQAAQAIDDLKATMGMYDPSLGNASNETSGRAIIARQREGDTASFSWIDNLSRSIQHTGRILIDMIPRIYDTERIVRVLGEDDSVEMVPINTYDEATDSLIHDMSVGKYDVEISVGPSFATKRLEAAESMIAFFQAFPQGAAAAADLVAKNMDWPGADDIAERLKKMLPPGMVDEEDDPEAMLTQQNQELQAQMQQMAEQMQGMAEELQKRDADKERAMVDEQERKNLETASKIETDAINRDSIELDNARKLLELMQGTNLDSLIQEKVDAILGTVTQ